MCGVSIIATLDYGFGSVYSYFRTITLWYLKGAGVSIRLNGNGLDILGTVVFISSAHVILFLYFHFAASKQTAVAIK